MQRIEKLEHATGKARTLLDSVQRSLGSTPNFFTTLAQAPAALEAYLGINAALSKGKLSDQLREQLALAVAGFNGCNYCAAAHNFLGEKAGIDEDERNANRVGQSTNPKTLAALKFAEALMNARGKITDQDLESVRAAGFDDEEIIEILAHVAMNTFSNYFNETAGTDIDFPKIVQTKETRVA